MATERSIDMNIPIIDVFDGKFGSGSEGWLLKCEEVRRAFEEHGCFLAKYDERCTQHQVFDCLKQLFDLPTSMKIRNVSNKPYFGYFKHPSFPLSESMGIDNPTFLHPTRRFTNLMWPNGNQVFSERIHTYAKVVSDLDRMVKKMVFDGYGVGKCYDSHIQSVDYLLRVIKYRVPKKDEEGFDGCPDHTDKSFITILHDNEVAGLQIKTKDGNWVNVQPSGSMFLVMAGDALVAWSNGRVHAPIHRVIPTVNKERYSLALFSFSGEIIKTPEELVDEAHPLRFKPFDNIDLLRMFSLDDFQQYSAHNPKYGA